MTNRDFLLTDADREAIRKLDDFLPQTVFDMHMHIGKPSFLPSLFAPGSAFQRCGEQVDMALYETMHAPLYGAPRRLRANMVVNPDPVMRTDSSTRAEAVRFLTKELQARPDCIGAVPVLPEDTVDTVAEMLVHPGIRGFRSYHYMAEGGGTWQKSPDTFVPEAAFAVADQRQLSVILHPARDLALGDADNLRYVTDMAKKYPRAKLILTHAGRGFAPWTIEEALPRLAPLENVYFTLSAVCEPLPFCHILKACGHGRVFWGSDYPVSMLRGKCVSLGLQSLWLYEKEIAAAGRADFPALLIGIENLLALRDACRLLSLTPAQIEDVFGGNAVRVFGLTP